MQAAVDVAVPAAFSGAEGTAVYIGAERKLPLSRHRTPRHPLFPHADTEGSFTPERAHQMASALVAHLHGVADVRPHRAARRQHRAASCVMTPTPSQSAGEDGPELAAAAAAVTPQSVLEGILVLRAHDYVQQMAAVADLERLLRTRPSVRLVVLDSVTFHFRQEFDDYAVRTRLLTSMAQQLHAVARSHRCAVVLVNQVTTRMRRGEGHLVPALGA